MSSPVSQTIINLRSGYDSETFSFNLADLRPFKHVFSWFFRPPNSTKKMKEIVNFGRINFFCVSSVSTYVLFHILMHDYNDNIFKHKFER